MRYFANPSTDSVRDAMRAGLIDFIDTPAQGNKRLPGVTWCADNGCYGKGWPGEESWLHWLASVPLDDRRLCAFAVAPDVVADAQATLERSWPWLPVLRYALGYRVAFVAQDGLTVAATPWDQIDVLFIGGSTAWKLGPEARELVQAAKAHGKWIHMGRVNSWKRYNYARRLGCDSADGTTLAMFPDATLPDVLGWIGTARERPILGATA